VRDIRFTLQLSRSRALWQALLDVGRELAPHFSATLEYYAQETGLNSWYWFTLLRVLASEPEPASREGLLRQSLWGNQNDLSMWKAGGKEGPPQWGGSNAHLLVDETLLAARLLDRGVDRLDILLDNTGSELASDLALVDFLLESKKAQQVVLHAKVYPTFVSDATPADVLTAVEFLDWNENPLAQAMGVRLKRQIETGRIQLREHFFWHSPLPFWELPEELSRELSQSSLILSKGDANYRRLLGDLHWPFTTSFREITVYSPAPLLTLRVLKSEIVVGLQPGQAETLSEQDPQWLVDGAWGVAQFTGS